MYNYKYKLAASRKHKNEHNRQKIGEMLKSIMSKFWSIIDSTLLCMDICTLVCVCAQVCVCVCVYVHAYMCMCVCMCVYVHVYSM